MTAPRSMLEILIVFFTQLRLEFVMPTLCVIIHVRIAVACSCLGDRHYRLLADQLSLAGDSDSTNRQ